MSITPGPWKIFKRDSWTQIRAEEGRTFICELCKPNEENTKDAVRAEADAKAIAAVPKMLDLLRDVAAGENSDGVKNECYRLLREIGVVSHDKE